MYAIISYIDPATKKQVDEEFPITDYEWQADSTPKVGFDESGSVSTASFEASLDATSLLVTTGHLARIVDPQRGEFYGIITGTSQDYASGLTRFELNGLLDVFNVKQVSMPPMHCSMKDMLLKWFRPKNPLVKLSVSADFGVGTRAWPGWYGDMWVMFKKLCVAYRLDVYTRGTAIYIASDRNGTKTYELDAQTEFQINQETHEPSDRVNLTWYETKWMINTQVYPRKGILPGQDTAVKPEDEKADRGDSFTVNAGEVATYNIPVAASMSSITSVKFNITADGKEEISNGRFIGAGGKVDVKIGKDTKSLDLTLVGPTSLREKGSGDTIRSFTLSKFKYKEWESDDVVTDDTQGLFVSATGTWSSAKVATGRTGVDQGKVEEDSLVEWDNLFVNTGVTAYRIVADQAFVERGYIMNCDGGGQLPYFDSGDMVVELGQWRVRELSINPSGYSFRADSELTYNDVKELFPNMTYNSVQQELKNTGRIYSYDDLIVLRFFSD